MIRHVLFDGQVYAEQSHGGVTRYFSSVIDGLAARGVWRPLIHAPLTRAPIPHGAQKLGASLAVPRLNRGFRLMRDLNARLTPPVSKLPEGTVYQPTWHHIATADRFKGLPTVFTVMDMIPERYAEVTSVEELGQRAQMFERADALVCISEATKSRLVELFPGTAAKATAVSIPIPDASLVRRSPSKALPYFVYIGKRSSYKNFELVLRALALTRPDTRLVFVGGGALEPGLAELADRLCVAERITHEVAPDDESLGQLLSRSSGLISPSLEEGFGLPPLEALAAGTRAIIADIPVYRDLYHNAAEFFAPTDASELATLMERFSGVDTEPLPQDLRGHLGWPTVDQILTDLESVYNAVSA